ncbi:DUF1217 domain-containing protein [Paracoccus seriniphilus]|uniref:DUF1217 domain-containing protein n=1 Tax=Paracoccus seriniphilus TaxID=184748 RepID=UPI003568231F
MATLAIGATGLQGWRILQDQAARHLEVLSQDPVVQRSTQKFEKNISSIDSAADLVRDYQMLHVALRTFGLDDDIGNKAFIQKVLESDLQDENSLANRLSDKRYLRLATTFDFQAGGANADSIIDTVSRDYLQREFEYRVGEADENLRLALNAQRELQEMSGRESSDRTLWYEVLANAPLKTVFEGAFGFGDGYANLSIDRQYEEFTKAAERFLGSSSFSDLTTADGIERLIDSFLLRSEMNNSSAQNRYSIALTLLSDTA